MKTLIQQFIFSLFCLIVSVDAVAETPFAVPTFHCLGIYWSPAGGSLNKDVLVEFRKQGNTDWRQGLNMAYYPISGTSADKTDYRGSIVNLFPNTSYEIKLTLEGTETTETFTAKTWSEDFPIGETITLGDKNSQYNITKSGTKDAWLLIDGTGSTIDVNNDSYYCIEVDANYVIIRGLTLKGAERHGIYFKDCHDIVVENCNISGWGRKEYGFGRNYEAALYSVSDELERVVVQRNLIHHPRWDANSWAEKNPKKDEYHPRGPQGVSFENSAGNHVIRYNEIWSDEDHMFNDVIGFGSNGSYEGFPGADSDIYYNYVANCWDDGIEAEGGNRNTRIWGNYIEEVYTAIGNAPVSIGPLYVWRNVSGRCYSPPGSKYGQYGKFLKMGYSGGIEMMTGHMYIFNNTVLQPNNEGSGGLGTSGPSWKPEPSNRHIRHCQSRNNIFHVHDVENSISTREENVDNDYDYDLCNQPYPAGHEANGVEGTPVYTSEAGFDFETMTANFSLDNSSPGYDVGTIIPNFVEQYEGSGPDMGAQENGLENFVCGVNAVFTPPVITSIHAIKSDHANIKVYPNPFINTVTFDLQELSQIDIIVTNITGKVVRRILNESGKVVIERDALKPGLYLYRVISDRVVVDTGKLIIVGSNN